MQAQFEELPRQRQDLEARELEVQLMSRTHNLNAVRDARVRSAASVRGSKHSREKEQLVSQLASQRSQTASGSPPSWIELIRTCITQNCGAPPASSQDGASQNVEAMAQDIVKLGVMPQKIPDQSQAQSDTVDPEPPQVEDFSSDQEDHSGTPALNEMLMVQEELNDYDSFTSPVVTKTPLWKFAEQTPSGSQAQAQPVTSTPVKPAGPQVMAPAQAQPQAQTQAQMQPPAPAQASSSLLLSTSGRSHSSS